VAVAVLRIAERPKEEARPQAPTLSSIWRLEHSIWTAPPPSVGRLSLMSYSARAAKPVGGLAADGAGARPPRADVISTENPALQLYWKEKGRCPAKLISPRSSSMPSPVEFSMARLQAGWIRPCKVMATA